MEMMNFQMISKIKVELNKEQIKLIIQLLRDYNDEDMIFNIDEENLVNETINILENLYDKILEGE